MSRASFNRPLAHTHLSQRIETPTGVPYHCPEARFPYGSHIPNGIHMWGVGRPIRQSTLLASLVLLCVRKAKADVFAVVAHLVHGPVATCHEGERDRTDDCWERRCSRGDCKTRIRLLGLYETDFTLSTLGRQANPPRTSRMPVNVNTWKCIGAHRLSFGKFSRRLKKRRDVRTLRGRFNPTSVLLSLTHGPLVEAVKDVPFALLNLVRFAEDWRGRMGNSGRGHRCPLVP